jgi:hypothetical protein
MKKHALSILLLVMGILGSAFGIVQSDLMLAKLGFGLIAISGLSFSGLFKN